MAVKRTVQEQEPMQYQQPVMRESSMWNKIGPFLVVVLVAMAFGMGYLWNKSSGTSNVPAAAGTGAAAVPAGKYKTLQAAFTDYAKQIGIDGNKLWSCATGGSKKAITDADTQEGSNFGVQGTPAFFINGRFLGGAFPYSAFKEIIDKELAGTGSNDAKDYSAMLQQVATGAQASFIPTPKTIPVGDAATMGDKNSKVTIVEYSDFQCPYCEQGYQTLKQVLADYSGKIYFVYKHFPLRQIHPNAEIAAETAICARDQGKFWEMHDKLFDNQSEWSNLQ